MCVHVASAVATAMLVSDASATALPEAPPVDDKCAHSKAELHNVQNMTGMKNFMSLVASVLKAASKNTSEQRVGFNDIHRYT